VRLDPLVREAGDGVAERAGTDDDGGAVGAQQSRDREAETLRPAGHDGDLASEVVAGGVGDGATEGHAGSLRAAASTGPGCGRGGARPGPLVLG